MIVHISGAVAEIAVTSLAGMAYSRSFPITGQEMDVRSSHPQVVAVERNCEGLGSAESGQRYRQPGQQPGTTAHPIIARR